MTKTLTEQWREGTLEEANKTIQDQELIIKRLKRRRICTNQKEKARKEHINELIAQVKELKEELARRGRIINELKTQRKEANEVIESLRTYDFTVDDENAEYYQVKWNVEAKRFYKNRKWGVK